MKNQSDTFIFDVMFDFHNQTHTTTKSAGEREKEKGGGGKSKSKDQIKLNSKAENVKTTNGLIKSEELLQKSENRISNCPNLIRQVCELNINFIAIEKLCAKFVVNVSSEISQGWLFCLTKP